MVVDATAGNFGVELSPRTWHTFVSLRSGTVLYEVKEGPYVVDADKVFAEWAPVEGGDDANAYVEGILARLGLEVD